MNNQDIIVEKTKELLSIRVYEGLKTAGEEFLAALGTDGEKAAAEKYAFELEDAVPTIDFVIDLFSSEDGIKRFGAERAKGIADHAREAKANGAVWCDCPACTAALEVLKYKADLLA